MRRINTLPELKAERKRLKLRRLFLEDEIKKEFRELKESLEPMHILGRTAKRSLENENNQLLGNSAGNIADFLARLTLRKTGLLSRLVLPLLLRNITSSLVEKNKSKIVNWIGLTITRITERKTLARQSFSREKVKQNEL